MSQKTSKWLLFFYTVPAKPGNLRMKVWRRLIKMAAASLKGSVYILPYSEDHLEALHWLRGEVASLGGEAAFVSVGRIETMGDEEIMALFNTQRENEYAPMEAILEALEIQVSSLPPQRDLKGLAGIKRAFQKLCKDYQAAQAIDFFLSPRGVALQARLATLEKSIKKFTLDPQTTRPALAGPRRPEEYRDKVWITRKNPFVDRMASAWLIRRFIDPQARFEFLETDRMVAAGTKGVSFDVPGGDFTHEEDRCTFEVLLEAFGLRGKALGQLAEVVHDLDLKDGKFANPQASGVEIILLGIRKTAKDDREALEEGIKTFERLYAALAR